MKTVTYQHDKRASFSRLVLFLSGALCGCSLSLGFTTESFGAEPVLAETKAPGLSVQLLKEQDGRKTWVLAFHKGDEG